VCKLGFEGCVCERGVSERGVRERGVYNGVCEGSFVPTQNQRRRGRLVRTLHVLINQA
jgi:hypothetical protein